MNYPVKNDEFESAVQSMNNIVDLSFITAHEALRNLVTRFGSFAVMCTLLVILDEHGDEVKRFKREYKFKYGIDVDESLDHRDEL